MGMKLNDFKMTANHPTPNSFPQLTLGYDKLGRSQTVTSFTILPVLQKHTMHVLSKKERKKGRNVTNGSTSLQLLWVCFLDTRTRNLFAFYHVAWRWKQPWLSSFIRNWVLGFFCTFLFCRAVYFYFVWKFCLKESYRNINCPYDDWKENGLDNSYTHHPGSRGFLYCFDTSKFYSFPSHPGIIAGPMPCF